MHLYMIAECPRHFSQHQPCHPTCVLFSWVLGEPSLAQGRYQCMKSLCLKSLCRLDCDGLRRHLPHAHPHRAPMHLYMIAECPRHFSQQQPCHPTCVLFSWVLGEASLAQDRYQCICPPYYRGVAALDASAQRMRSLLQMVLPHPHPQILPSTPKLRCNEQCFPLYLSLSRHKDPACC